jgi:hypothetical protein
MITYDYEFMSQYLKIPTQVSKQVDLIYKDEQQEVRHCMKLIIINILIMGRVVCSRSKRFFVRNSTKEYTYKYFTTALNILIKDGYVEILRIGYKRGILNKIWYSYYIQVS